MKFLRVKFSLSAEAGGETHFYGSVATIFAMSNTEASLSIEHLLKLLVREWQLTRTSPMGKPKSGVEYNGDEVSIQLSPLTMHQSGCPRNFHDFYETAKLLPGMQTKRDAFLWYCRTRLHYSCSTICVTFTEFEVPELLKRGISSLDSVDVKKIR